MADTTHTSEIHRIASLTLQHITGDHISHVDESLHTVGSTLHVSQSASDVSTTTTSGVTLKRDRANQVARSHQCATSRAQESPSSVQNDSVHTACSTDSIAFFHCQPCTTRFESSRIESVDLPYHTATTHCSQSTQVINVCGSVIGTHYNSVFRHLSLDCSAAINHAV